jgi:hypothetical protein
MVALWQAGSKVVAYRSLPSLYSNRWLIFNIFVLASNTSLLTPANLVTLENMRLATIYFSFL